MGPAFNSGQDKGGFDPRFVLYCWAPRPSGGRALWERTQWAMAAHVRRSAWQNVCHLPIAFW